MLIGKYFMYHKYTLFFFALILVSNVNLTAHPNSALRRARESWPVRTDEQIEQIRLNAHTLRKHPQRHLKKILAHQLEIFEILLSIHDSPFFPKCLINTANDFIENQRKDFRVSSLLLLPLLMETEYKKISTLPTKVAINATQNINLFLWRLLGIIFAFREESDENILIIQKIVEQVLKRQKACLSRIAETPTHSLALQRPISR